MALYADVSIAHWHYIQNFPHKTGPLSRQNQARGSVLSGTPCILQFTTDKAV
jgi:hypothetical protein